VSLLNLNPLIKLDGYYIFCELIGEPDFKERTSAYLAGWTRKHLFGMPAEVEYIPLRRRPFYLVYAVLSAIYGYLLLTFLMGFTFNVLHSYSPAWAFAPAALMGYWVFRERIHSSGRFTKLFYLDKKERVWSWLKPWRFGALAAAVLLLLFLPIWPDFEEGAFVLEPARQAVVHAAVPGTVRQVFVDEGQHIVAGQPLATLENLDLESDLARVRADLRTASARATQSQLHYGDVGATQQERLRLQQADRSLTEEAAKLQLISPIAGVVATARPHDLQGVTLEEGAAVVELIDESVLRARIYIPEFAMHDVHVGAPVRLRVESRVLAVNGTVQSLSADWAPLDPSFSQKEQLAGINPPRYYMAESWLAPAVDLRPGMTGTAKIRVGRRSMGSFSLRFMRDLVGRRVW
jgi:putative peptide zinc metalloprotease protein